jgi:hypothetical protein
MIHVIGAPNGQSEQLCIYLFNTFFFVIKQVIQISGVSKAGPGGRAPTLTFIRGIAPIRGKLRCFTSFLSNLASVGGIETLPFPRPDGQIGIKIVNFRALRAHLSKNINLEARLKPKCTLIMVRLMLIFKNVRVMNT